jgi:peptide/nickel transport system ATP-binding protein
MNNSSVLAVHNLRISIATDEGLARILDYVNFELPRSHILGIAGESGCGKSTLISAILGILPKRAVVQKGEILFEGMDLLRTDKRHLRSQILGRAIGFIPQDPFLAFNPVFKVGKQLMETLRWHGLPGEEPGYVGRAQRRRHRDYLVTLLSAVQMPDPEDALERYPHQFSGGQRQRLLIAAALASRPKILLADEPTTALDVTTQLQILKLLKNLVDKFAMSMLFVTHDFGVIAQICDSVSVMYAGQTIETGRTRMVIDAPQHPYTRSLIDCHPERSSEMHGIPGQVPSPLMPPSGCRYGPRCQHFSPICAKARPALTSRHASGNEVACVLNR